MGSSHPEEHQADTGAGTLDMTNGHTRTEGEPDHMDATPICPFKSDIPAQAELAVEEDAPIRNEPVPGNEELEDLGLPEIVKQRIKLQRSLFEEKQRMYMFEKNYLQSAALYCHGNILAGYRHKPGPFKGPTKPRFSFSDSAMRKCIVQMERKVKADPALRLGGSHGNAPQPSVK